MRNPIRLGALAAVAALALAGCGGTETGAAATDCDEVTIDAATVRVPPAANAAAYFTISNDGADDTAIVAASGDFADVFELHEVTADDEGVMSMRPIDGQEIPVPAGETVTLEPGGLHVMALDVADDLAGLDEVDLTLTLADGCEREVVLAVEALAEGGMGDMGHGDHDHGDKGDGDHGDHDHGDGDPGDGDMGDGDAADDAGTDAASLTIDVSGLHTVDVDLAEGQWDPEALLATLQPTLDSVAVYGGDVDLTELEALLTDLVAAIESGDRDRATALAAVGHSLAHDLEDEMAGR